MRTPQTRPVLRVYLRRSKGDDQQTHSLDVQRAGCARFAATLGDLPPPIEYADDDRAGDDFVGRAGLQRLLREVSSGDVVLVRDQSRLGRDAIETALVVRTIVRDRKARLYYYASGELVKFANAADALVAVAKGAGGEMELEAIRSRTAEALRERVRSGRLAGGRCYGYRNVQHPDKEGRRKNTRAEVDETQAAIVRRVFEAYAGGAGLGAIAKALNRDRVPPPSAGARGTGSWAPSAIRSMLLNDRYSGVYVHGRIIRKRQGGKRIASRADESTVLRVAVPEWRIVDEVTWARVQARFAAQAGKVWTGGHQVYPLAGLARCGACGGPIGVVSTKTGVRRISAYGCTYHRKRGSEVCAVTNMQPRDVVEGAVIRQLLDEVLAPEVVQEITARVVELARAERDQPGEADTVATMESELEGLRAEQKRCARLLARLDDAGELEAEYNARTAKIRSLEADLAAARAAPVAAALALDALAGEVAEVFATLRAGLVAAPEEARAALRALFPRGLRFEPSGSGWEITGRPEIRPTGVLPLVTPLGHAGSWPRVPVRAALASSAVGPLA
jgi:DNA invertase Pin-like site-specific DNA recombinase